MNMCWPIVSPEFIEAYLTGTAHNVSIGFSCVVKQDATWKFYQYQSHESLAQSVIHTSKSNIT